MLDVFLRHRFPGPGGFALDAGFAAPARGVTAIFGASGCGKSTVLATVAGLLRPDAGRVTLNDRVLLDTERGVTLPPEARRCGVVFQDARLFPHRTVAGNLRYGLRRAPSGARGPDFAEVVDLLGLDRLLQRLPAGLSGGEKQRVALGRALLCRPELLLMDEPLAALDAARKAEVLPFLARVRDAAGIPLLYVTHALDEVDRLADELVLMEHGRVVASGSVEVLSARTDLPILAARRDAGALLRCVVRAHEPARGLTVLCFPGGELLVPLQRTIPGATVRLRVRARDVSVATTEPRGLSVRNVLAARVESVEASRPHEAMLRLRVGSAVLLSRITADALSDLSLAPGQPVWALLKSVAFDPPPGNGEGKEW